MTLTPYTKAGTMHAVNIEVADREALTVEEQYRVDYAIARRDYKLQRERFFTRSLPLQVVQLIDPLEDLSTYTSAPSPGELEYYYRDREGPDNRDIEKELLERARLRQKDDNQARLSIGKKKPKVDFLKTLMKRQEEEYEDILDIEAEYFKKLAKQYYDSVFGDVANLVWQEQQARQIMEDISMSVELGQLADLREQIFLSEERLMMRAMDMHAQHLLRNRGENAGDTAAHPQELDLMYAVPLCRHVEAIRGETINEEEMSYLNLNLGFKTQADLIRKGFFRRNENDILERVEGVEVPYYLNEAVAFAFTAERFRTEADEETTRMSLVEEAVAEEEKLFGEYCEGFSGLELMAEDL